MASLNGGTKFLVASKTSLVKSKCFFIDLSYLYYPKELLQNYFRSRLELILTLFRMGLSEATHGSGGRAKRPTSEYVAYITDNDGIWHS